MRDRDLLIDRRRAIKLVGAAGATVLAGSLSEADAATCLATPTQTEGPYFVEENLNRSDIRSDPMTGAVKPGVLLTIKMTVSLANDSGCGALPGARVEIWHCDAGGLYSDVVQNSTRGQEFLRGYQITDENGVVNFTTVYPGWYMGRAVHIHFKVRTYSGATKLDEFTSQFFFDESLTDVVHAQAPYSARGRRDTLNSTDMIFRSTPNAERLLATTTRTAEGYAATIDVAVNLRTPEVSRAVLSSSGVVNAASYQPGVAPGAWITIFGRNLAATTRAVATSDLVNNNLPTSLGGVSVKINGKDAFVQYVSPTQVNVQAPADEKYRGCPGDSDERRGHFRRGYRAAPEYLSGVFHIRQLRCGSSLGRSDHYGYGVHGERDDAGCQTWGNGFIVRQRIRSDESSGRARTRRADRGSAHQRGDHHNRRTSSSGVVRRSVRDRLVPIQRHRPGVGGGRSRGDR
ncbi:MAG: hypothetical protein HYS04_16250 [Acidobacteria bacterium]|nr:hypothetical protein [Acidobacteriota bacterium]